MTNSFQVSRKFRILTSHFAKRITNNFISSTRKMSSDKNVVLFEEIKNKGVITLNRPKALNALDTSMIEKIYRALKKWENEKSSVIIKGAGGKSFSAGADVRAIVLAGLKGDKSLGQIFFKKEYITNGLIGSYKIPCIALVHGIVMGGGVGLSIHGRYRVATERTLFAMPETQIGLFPDVGASYFLPRLGRLGLYLALTGHRLSGWDVLKAGIATHYCESKSLEALKTRLVNECDNDGDIRNVLQKFSAKVDKEFSLSPHLEKINKCFAPNNVELIIKNLENDGSSWATGTIKTLKKMSPTSLRVTAKALELGSKLNLRDCLRMEYRIAVNCLENKDFYEGVRALLIDKDKKPVWNPPTLVEVTDKYVDSYFLKLSDELELKHER